MMKEKALLGLILLLFTTACMRKELPVEPRDRGDAQVVQSCMGPGYQQQLWIDLGTASVVSSNPKSAWDLAFESAASGWRIMLNGSRLITVWNIGTVDIMLPTDTNGMFAQRRIDAPSGHPDSTAFGNTWASGDVFVVHLGYNSLGQSMGLRKFRADQVNAQGYSFTLANVDGSDVTTVQLPKDGTRTYTYFSFATNSAVTIEPPLGTWDIQVTQYTHQFWVPFLPYIVSGVLTDPGQTRVARIASGNFDELSLADTLVHSFQPWRNVIGFDWKDYSFDTGTYEVYPDIVYILQDPEGRFFKLHFLDFYDGQGQVGCPSFEVKEL